jgi:hypothetical protein
MVVEVLELRKLLVSGTYMPRQFNAWDDKGRVGSVHYNVPRGVREGKSIFRGLGNDGYCHSTTLSNDRTTKNRPEYQTTSFR